MQKTSTILNPETVYFSVAFSLLLTFRISIVKANKKPLFIQGCCEFSFSTVLQRHLCPLCLLVTH